MYREDEPVTRTYYELIDRGVGTLGVIDATPHKRAGLMHYLFESEEDAEIWLTPLVPSRRKYFQHMGYRAWHPSFIAACHVEMPHPRMTVTPSTPERSTP